MLTFLTRAALLLTAACSVAHAQAPRPPLEHFFGDARFSRPALSPDGKLLAVVVGLPGRRNALRVIELDTNKLHATAAYEDADIGDFQWVNNQRLIHDLEERDRTRSQLDLWPGLYAVNADGSEMRQLAPRRYSDASEMIERGRMLSPRAILAPDPGLQNSDAVYVNERVFRDDDTEERRLLQVDTKTGRSRPVAGTAGVVEWLLDHEGEPRITYSRKEQMGFIHWRQGSGSDWKKISSFNVFAGSKDAIDPLAFAADGTLYVLANKGNTSAVHTYNPVTERLSEEPVIETAGYDFRGGLIMKNGVLQGFRFVTDAHSTHWVDPAMAALQKEIDAKLVGTVNTISVPRRPAAPWVLVQAHSDRLPPTVLLYNTTTKKFQNVGSSNPDIKPEQMGRQESFSFTARDGLQIPALLTLPAGQRSKLPLVVLVHGGPWVRGSVWGWEPESQFLASRGYAVLEPSFRGTTGFGQKHYRASFRQWGLSMQDDLADAARWAISQGIADPGRICIAGASYGGYATLMGLIKDPDLFKCGVNWVGVTDLTLMKEGSWLYRNDMSEAYLSHGFPEMVGDVVKDAEQFKATSPLVQAARIKQPLLLAYGEVDRRVPLDHGTKLRDAVKRTNPDVEWVSYPNEGHGFFLVKNRIDFYRRMEAFLDRHIGKAAPPAQ